MTETPRKTEYRPRNRGLHPPAHAPAYRSSVLRSPRALLLSLEQTLSEITGPVFSAAELDPLDNDLLRNHATTGDPVGERIIVHGTVRDETSRPVPDTLIEVWQANAGGRYSGTRRTATSRPSTRISAAAGGA